MLYPTAKESCYAVYLFSIVLLCLWQLHLKCQQATWNSGVRFAALQTFRKIISFKATRENIKREAPMLNKCCVRFCFPNTYFFLEKQPQHKPNLSKERLKTVSCAEVNVLMCWKLQKDPWAVWASGTGVYTCKWTKNNYLTAERGA